MIVDPDVQKQDTHRLEGELRAQRARVVEAARRGSMPRDQADAKLEKIETALAWLEAGLYGPCSVCGRDLDRAARSNDPADMVCEACRAASVGGTNASAIEALSVRDGAEELNRSFEHVRRLVSDN